MPETPRKKIVIAAGAVREGRRAGSPRASAHTGRGPAGIPASAQTEREPMTVGTTVDDRYELLETLDEGGTGLVYRAHDQVLDMIVALKFLTPQLNEDPETVDALKAEARIALSMSHPNIVRLYNLERTANGYFLVMEYVEGESLRKLLRAHNCFDAASTLSIISSCCDALIYAHANGVYHNDLKPDNLLLRGDGVLKIIDFGTACLAGMQLGKDYITGTPAYMSPEQKQGEPIDHHTDVYALGILAFEFLTGHIPYPAQATQSDMLSLQPSPLVGLEPQTCAVLQRAMTAAPAERWPSVRDFKIAFETALQQGHAAQL